MHTEQVSDPSNHWIPSLWGSVDNLSLVFLVCLTYTLKHKSKKPKQQFSYMKTHEIKLYKRIQYVFFLIANKVK
jgi:hypothetical protein